MATTGGNPNKTVSAVKTLSQFWTGQTGRCVVAVGNFLGALGITAAYIGAHTVFLDKYRDVIRMYRYHGLTGFWQLTFFSPHSHVYYF